MAADREETTVILSEDDHPKPSHFFGRCFKIMYQVMGFSFTGRRNKWNLILSTLMVVRAAFTRLASLPEDLQEKARPVYVINDLAYDILPPAEFVLLASLLPKFNDQIEKYTRHINMKTKNISIVR